MFEVIPKFVLSTGFSWGLLRWSSSVCTVPLKLGLIRASYPDVFPMSLSRKSEGDSWGPALPGGFISSLQELSLTLPGGKGGKGGNKCKEKEKEKERKIWETAVEECVCIRGSSGGGGEKNNENQNKKPTAIAKSVISRKYPAVDEEMRVKNDEWTACLSWQLKAYLSHIMSETYCGC